MPCMLSRNGLVLKVRARLYFSDRNQSFQWFSNCSMLTSSPEESAWKMLGIMSKDDFKNGTHVDYFDQSYEKAEDKVVL